jgi:ATP-dependent Clp protease ATP-binding subunit ClpA
MFERYTERARRVIFFARYEASQTGSPAIETEHFILALLREDKNLVMRLLKTVTPTEIREEILSQITMREKVPTSIDLPLSDECRRILAYAAEEAERLNHNHIGTEHLLLGILREQKCLAALVLTQHGMKLEEVREHLAQAKFDVDLSPGSPTEGIMMHRLASNNPNLPRNGVVPDEQTAKRVAEAIWTPVYGADRVAAQAPLKAELKANVWIVSGAPADDTALHAFILKFNGTVLVIGEGQSPK